MPIYILWNYEKGGKKHAGKHETADEDMLSTLGRAGQSWIPGQSRETEEIARLLEDMQASAMAIGTAIEQVEETHADGKASGGLLRTALAVYGGGGFKRSVSARAGSWQASVGKSVPAWRLSLKCGWKSFSLCAEAGPGSRWNVSTIS